MTHNLWEGARCCCKSLNHVWLFETTWTVACQASLSPEFDMHQNSMEELLKHKLLVLPQSFWFVTYGWSLRTGISKKFSDKTVTSQRTTVCKPLLHNNSFHTEGAKWVSHLDTLLKQRVQAPPSRNFDLVGLQ